MQYQSICTVKFLLPEPDLSRAFIGMAQVIRATNETVMQDNWG